MRRFNPLWVAGTLALTAAEREYSSAMPPPHPRTGFPGASGASAPGRDAFDFRHGNRPGFPRLIRRGLPAAFRQAGAHRRSPLPAGVTAPVDATAAAAAERLPPRLRRQRLPHPVRFRACSAKPARGAGLADQEPAWCCSRCRRARLQHPNGQKQTANQNALAADACDRRPPTAARC